MTVESIDLPRERDFALGPVQVRPAVREVAGPGGSETLEPRVMEVLVALARAGGAVVSRDDLISACWGGRIVGEDAIQRCIQRLRKLQEAQGGFSIETIAKVGYRLLTDAGAGTSAPVEAPRPAPVATIAVLPFVNMSSDPEQDYFSDGLTDELMNQLAQLKGLRVAGRTSAFAYKGHNEDLRRIGEKLGVAHILEGSVRKAGSRLRIAAQLIKAADGYHLWAQTYDRELDDVFAIQDEIASAVSRAMSATLGLRIGQDYGGTRSFAAYDQFLRGRITGLEADVPALMRHAEHLRQAVTLDPSYAVAWADLANLLARLQSQLLAAEARPFKAERDHAASRALALAPDLAEAHVAEGWRQANDRVWLAADAAFQRAISLAPHPDPLSVGVVGGFISGVGRVREGLPFREGARDTDPLALLWSFNTQSSYLSLGMNAAYEAEYLRSQGLQGDYRRRVEALRLTYLLMSGADAAAVTAQFDRITSEPSSAPFYRALAAAYPDADAAVAVLRGSFDTSSRQLVAIAELAGVFGQVDMSLEALGRVEPDVTIAHLHMLWRPGFRAVRADPRFKDLMAAFGLATFWRASGKWPDFARPTSATDYEFTG